MSGRAPAVSVIVAMYQAREHIGRALASVRAQTVAEHEVVVVDDGSSDGGADLVEAMDDPRVRLIRLGANGGPGAARNVAIEHARGSWITVLDADDVHHPRRLEVLLRHAVALDDRTILIDGIQHLAVGRHGRLVPLRVPNLLPGQRVCEDASSVDPEVWLRSGKGAKPFVSRQLVDGIRYPADARFGEDYLFMATLLAEQATRLVQVHHALYGYVLRPGTLRSDTTGRAELVDHLDRWAAARPDHPAAAAVRENAARLRAESRATRPARGARTRVVQRASLAVANVGARLRAAARSPGGVWPGPLSSPGCGISEASEGGA